MNALAIVTLIIFTACLWWIEAEQKDWERKHYDPRLALERNDD